MKLELISINEGGFATQIPKPLSETARQVCEMMAANYHATGYVKPWIGYLGWDGQEWIGTCAFKTPPKNGRVEIAYFTFPQFENRGWATLMAQRLIVMAEKTDPSIVLTAQTLPDKSPSTSVLKKLGFTFIGPLHHPEDGLVWEWQLSKRTDER